MTKASRGGRDRVSTKTKLARELLAAGEVLARARERLGVKQSDLAARLALPPSHLSKIENGSRRIDVVELIQICHALGIPAAELIEEIESAIAPPEAPEA